MKKGVKNIAASVRTRLINIARENKRDYNALLRIYFQERFLYRLSISSYKTKLILKGALLLMMKDISKFRPTKDIDFLGKVVSNEMNECKKIIKEIASIYAADGVEFIIEEITVEKIKEDAEYEGVRLYLPYKMDTIKGYFTIDIGFGDKIVDGPLEIDFPVLLDFPAPHIFVYSFESAVAEKFEAIVKLNFLTSRMKDFFDILFIAERTTFNKNRLKEALLVTFNNRETDIDERHLIYQDDFRQNPEKQIQWLSFLGQNNLVSENIFSKVIDRINLFIEPTFGNEATNSWNCQDWKWE